MMGFAKKQQSGLSGGNIMGQAGAHEARQRIDIAYMKNRVGAVAPTALNVRQPLGVFMYIS